MTQYLGNAFEYALDRWDQEPLGEGHPIVETGAHHIAKFGGVDIGVWASHPGVIHAVTDDEIFIVLEGHAVVTFEDTRETINVGPGDVVRLHAGQRNTWHTIERLRKISVWVDPRTA